MGTLNLSDLRTANVTRCEEVFHPLAAWSLTDWGCAVGGEVGEALNLAKKIHRGDFSLDDVRGDLGAELADVAIYLDLLAARAGIDLAEAVIAKFNLVSFRRGSTVRLCSHCGAALRIDAAHACMSQVVRGQIDASSREIARLRARIAELEAECAAAIHPAECGRIHSDDDDEAACHDCATRARRAIEVFRKERDL